MRDSLKSNPTLRFASTYHVPHLIERMGAVVSLALSNPRALIVSSHPIFTIDLSPQCFLHSLQKGSGNQCIPTLGISGFSCFVFAFSSSSIPLFERGSPFPGRVVGYLYKNFFAARFFLLCSLDVPPVSFSFFSHMLGLPLKPLPWSRSRLSLQLFVDHVHSYCFPIMRPHRFSLLFFKIAALAPVGKLYNFQHNPDVP